MAGPGTQQRLEPPLRVLAALTRGVLGDRYIPEVPLRSWETVSSRSARAVARAAEEVRMVLLRCSMPSPKAEGRSSAMNV